MSYDGSIVYEVNLDYGNFKQGLEETKKESTDAGKAIEKGIGGGADSARQNIEKLKDTQKNLNELYKSGSIGDKQRQTRPRAGRVQYLGIYLCV